MSPVGIEATRYEQIMAACSQRPGDLPAQLAEARRAARAAVGATSDHEAAIRDVAVGVAAPALVSFALWIQQQSQRRGLRRLRFLYRDGQVLHELMRRLPPMSAASLDLEYVYSSRLTWSLAATQPDHLAEASPFIMETFCMGDHGIVSGYRADAAGQTKPVLLSPRNDAAEAWGLRLYRSTLYAFCTALDTGRIPPDDDVRPLVHQVLDAFWCHPTHAEALAWGAYPYDSDPAGTAVRPLARPFTLQDHAARGDRAWIAGSLALSTPEARTAYLHYAPEHERTGAPETD